MDAHNIIIRKEFDEIRASVSKELEEYQVYKIKLMRYRYLHSRFKCEVSIPVDLLDRGLGIIRSIRSNVDRLIKLADEVEFTPSEKETFDENISNVIDILEIEERQIKADVGEGGINNE